MQIPDEIFKQFWHYIAQVRWFYKNKPLKWKSETKTKYTICVKIIEKLSIYTFIITTSKNYQCDYWEENMFVFEKGDIKDLRDTDLKYLQDTWYIHCWKANELFLFLHKDEFSERFFSQQIRKIWLLCNKKFKTLQKMMSNNKNVQKNYNTTYNTFIDTQSFVEKYNLG